MSVPKILVQVVSDTMCPWCFVGKRKMESAFAEFGDKATFEVEWLPYFLNSKLPEEGITFENYMEAVYGSSAGLPAARQRLKQVGAEEGINFKFAGEGRPNLIKPTLRSHKLIEFSKKYDKLDDTVEKIFSMYFEGSGELNSVKDLVEVANDVGLPKEEVKK